MTLGGHAQQPPRHNSFEGESSNCIWRGEQVRLVLLCACYRQTVWLVALFGVLADILLVRGGELLKLLDRLRELKQRLLVDLR